MRNRVWTKVGVDFLAVYGKWESVIKQANVQGYFHLHDQTIVYELCLWVGAILCLVGEPLVSVLLEAFAKGRLSIVSYSLHWSVDHRFVIVDPITELRALIHNDLSFVLPIGPANHADTVVKEAAIHLCSVGIEVLRVWRGTGSQHYGNADILVIPLWDGTHTS